MIIIDKPKLKFLLAGRAVQIEAGREYRKGRSYALGLSHKRSICRVEVLDVDGSDEMGWVLSVKLASTDTPRLLAADPAGMRSDYVSDPQKAARGEPEALTDAQLHDLTKFRAAVDHGRRVAPMLDMRDRLVAELDEALRSNVSRDTKDKIRAARHHLRKIDRAS